MSRFQGTWSYEGDDHLLPRDLFPLALDSQPHNCQTHWLQWRFQGVKMACLQETWCREEDDHLLPRGVFSSAPSHTDSHCCQTHWLQVVFWDWDVIFARDVWCCEGDDHLLPPAMYSLAPSHSAKHAQWLQAAFSDWEVVFARGARRCEISQGTVPTPRNRDNTSVPHEWQVCKHLWKRGPPEIWATDLQLLSLDPQTLEYGGRCQNAPVGPVGRGPGACRGQGKPKSVMWAHPKQVETGVSWQKVAWNFWNSALERKKGKDFLKDLSCTGAVTRQIAHRAPSQWSNLLQSGRPVYFL